MLCAVVLVASACLRRCSILTSYVLLPETLFQPKIPMSSVGFQTFLVSALVLMHGWR